MTARCPNCRSTNVIPDQSPGGAGRNYCRQCRQTAPVRDFHQSPMTGHAAVNHYVEQLREHVRQNPIRIADMLNTSTPAAPIRQYKDD